MYAAPEPPADFGLPTEVEGIAHAARKRGFDRFHLVGYSAGGSCALAYTVFHPEQVLSLALLEPAWVAGEPTRQEEAVREGLRAARGLPPEELMGAFARLQLAPGVAPPPAPEGPPPPWMAKRPAGIRAFLDVFARETLNEEALRAYHRPAYFALGGRSNQDLYGQMAQRLASLLPDFTVEVFEERHHFDPPHRAEPKRLAASLLSMWQRAERAA